MKIKFALALSAFCGFTAAFDTDAQAFTGWNHLDHTYMGVGTSYQVGAGLGTQSFLGGVWGNLGQTNSAVSTSVNNTTLMFGLFLNPNNASSENGGEAYAIYPGNNTLPKTSCTYNGDNEFISKPSSGTFGCWITGLSNLNGNSWGAWTDKATVEYTLIGGSYYPSIHCYGNAEATAQCAPYTTYVNGGGGGSQTTTTNTDLGPNGATSPNYEACLLRSVNGTFRSNSGAGVQAAIVFGSEWFLGTSAGTGAFVDCIE